MRFMYLSLPKDKQIVPIEADMNEKQLKLASFWEYIHTLTLPNDIPEGIPDKDLIAVYFEVSRKSRWESYYRGTPMNRRGLVSEFDEHMLIGWFGDDERAELAVRRCQTDYPFLKLSAYRFGEMDRWVAMHLSGYDRGMHASSSYHNPELKYDWSAKLFDVRRNFDPMEFH